ncbi:MAG: hypothetical protein Q9204_000569 [Flavoplaca sp. TL-2023a]
MSGKRLLDAVALWKAARSVASKHAALRTHQFETYQKTSSLAKAVRGQTDSVTLPVKAASALARRVQQPSEAYGTQPPSQDPNRLSPKIPSSDSVQNPRGTPVVKEGLPQDHFYAKSEQNSTKQTLPQHDIGVRQESAKRYPLPDGTIPPVGSDLNSSTLGKATFSTSQQTEPQKIPLNKEHSQTESSIEPSSSGETSIPDPPNKPTSLHPDEVRKLQREAENQIPSQAAETQLPELGVGQEQDVFYTPSPKTDRVLSALPRVKLPKITVDKQNSLSRVSDKGIDQDVFYSSDSSDQEQAMPEQQAIPRQKEASVEMYSELFQSPKVAKMLSGSPKPADSSKGLNLEGAKQAPMQGSNSAPGGDPESFNVRPTAKAENESPKTQRSSDPPAPSHNSSKEDTQTLATDIASDTSQVLANADRVSITSTPKDTQ